MEPGVQPHSGLQPFKADKRTFSHSRVFGSLSPAQLPKEGLGRVPLKVVNQFQTQFCTAAGTSTASEYQEKLPLSFEFQIAAISRLKGQPILNGCDPYTAMKARVAFGCLEDKDTPEHLRLKPDMSNAAYIADWRNWPEHLWEKAKEHAAAAYFRVDGPHDHFDNARVALYQGTFEQQAIVAFGRWEEAWNRVGEDGIITSLITPLVGYHCYDLIDFVTIDGVEYIVAQNSYGTLFGKRGLQFFDRRTFNRVWQGLGANVELFIYRDVSPETIAEQKSSLRFIVADLYLQLIKALYALLTKKPDPTPTPPPPEPPQPAPEASKIRTWALAIEKQEGGGPKHLNTRLNNPGNLKATDFTLSLAPGASVGPAATDGGHFLKFDTREHGLQALCRFLELACRNELVPDRKSRTILTFTRTYAHPPNDNYARAVAEALGVSVHTRIETLL